MIEANIKILDSNKGSLISQASTARRLMKEYEETKERLSRTPEPMTGVQKLAFLNEIIELQEADEDIVAHNKLILAATVPVDTDGVPIPE